MNTEEEEQVTMQNQIFAKVRAFAQKNRIFEDCALVVAGVSGGGDSMAMLDILRQLAQEYGFALRAVHVNHGIRGAEADRDQKLVEETCRSWKIPYRVYSYDVPGLARQWKKGLEDTGRRVRKEAFFAELMEAQVSGNGKKQIALAHNKNDLAETMLHHLCRGTGLRGLSPMQPEKEGILRPVLCLERKEIDQYLKERGISFVLDSTNLEDEYTRNRIRHHLIPVLESEINERAVSHMAETSELLGQAEDFFTARGRSLGEKCRREDGSYLFDRTFFEKEEILRKYAVREAMEQLAGQRRDLSMIHIRSVLALWHSGTGALAELPFSLSAVRGYEGVVLRKGQAQEAVRTEEKEAVLPVPGALLSPWGSFETKIFSWSGQKICEKTYTKWLDYDKMKYDISVRTRAAGDYLVVNSQGHRKKLTRCMIDEKIPREERDRIPLVVMGDEVLWIVGGRINERYKITSETKDVLEIKYQGGYYNE